ncbi:MAG: GLPGLI family protein [Duncaniella sp.]|nr:GLPGLI family protein [Duncaniella sp.]
MQNRLLLMLLVLCVAFSMHANKKEYSRAEIKVSYNYHNIFVRGTDGVIERDIPFELLASSSESKFFCRSTEYKDSLESTPSGRAIAKQVFDAAIKRYIESKDEADLASVVYKTQLYVFKSRTKEEYNVYDYVGMTGNFHYSEPLDNIMWNIGDYTKTVLGYECVMATADYHGRKWTVWFAPEIPVQDGPWKLHGLPGLILEASETDGQHYFIANGIEATDEEILPVYDKKRYDKTSRIEMLRMERHARSNNNAMMKAQLDIDVGPDAAETEETKVYDFLETDYH